jgi:hypothetical protein
VISKNTSVDSIKHQTMESALLNGVSETLLHMEGDNPSDVAKGESHENTEDFSDSESSEMIHMKYMADLKYRAGRNARLTKRRVILEKGYLPPDLKNGETTAEKRTLCIPQRRVATRQPTPGPGSDYGPRLELTSSEEDD